MVHKNYQPFVDPPCVSAACACFGILRSLSGPGARFAARTEPPLSEVDRDIRCSVLVGGVVPGGLKEPRCSTDNRSCRIVMSRTIFGLVSCILTALDVAMASGLRALAMCHNVL